MSLLNKALRKKDIERERSSETGVLYKASTTSKKGKTKIYIIVLIVVFISITGALGALKFFYLQGPATIQPQLIAQRPDPQAVNPHKGVQSTRIVTGHEQEGKKKTMQEATGAEKQRPQATKTDRSLVEQKKVLKRGSKKELNPALTTVNPVKRKKKDKIRLKVTTKQSIDHETLDLFFQKALTYHRQNRLDEAIQMYQEVLLKNPKHVEALFNLSSAYVKMSNFSKAYPMIEKLNNMDPENPQILLNLAIVEIGLGRTQSALKHLAVAEKQKGAPQFEIDFHRGVVLSQLGNLNEAMVWYKKAEELRSHHPRLLFNMALLYDKMQNYPQAIRYYSSYLQLNLSSPNEKKEIESRIVTLKAYMVNRSKNMIESKP
jgi:Flp pilus assembly protein TadD